MLDAKAVVRDDGWSYGSRIQARIPTNDTPTTQARLASRCAHPTGRFHTDHFDQCGCASAANKKLNDNMKKQGCDAKPKNVATRRDSDSVQG